MGLRRSFREIPPTEGEYFRGKLPRSKAWALARAIFAGLALGIALGLGLVLILMGPDAPMITALLKIKDTVLVP